MNAPFDSTGATPALVVGSAAIPINLFQRFRDICPQMRRGVVVAIETLLDACARHFLGRALMFLDQDVSETLQFLAVTHVRDLPAAGPAAGSASYVPEGTGLGIVNRPCGIPSGTRTPAGLTASLIERQDDALCFTP